MFDLTDVELVSEHAGLAADHAVLRSLARIAIDLAASAGADPRILADLQCLVNRAAREPKLANLP